MVDDEGALRRTVLIIATLAAFLTPFMGSAVHVALPSIGSEFGMDAISLSWIASSYLLSTAMFLVPLGRYADIYGRKRIFSLGVLVFSASALFAALSFSGTMLILFRFLEGIGSAMIYGTGIAMITSVFPSGERGRALGINVTAVYLGLSLGPMLGGLLTEYLTWRSIFLANIPLGIYILASIQRHLRVEWTDARGERFDLPGSLLYAAMLLAIMYGFSQLPGAAGFWLILIGGAIFVLFVRMEGRVESPVLNVRLFRQNRRFAFSNLAALINYGATFAVGFLLSLYLQYVRGFDPGIAGLILIGQPVIQSIFATPAGRLSDRVDPAWVASAGMSLTAVGLILLTFLDEQTAMAYVVGCLVLLGFGFALFSSPNTNAIMSCVDRSFYGVASGMLATMRTVGMMFSLGIATVAIAVFLGSVPISPEYYREFLLAMQAAFTLFAGLCILGVFASLARGPACPSPGRGA
ncbi:MAG: MFS transporter [Methanomicrobiaceae archaeon]|nr:MFS transporter [Methanomicrobiaceae archaeon]MDD5420377.1 MFS transporter [Methanomicrobiaceae archaeon]